MNHLEQFAHDVRELLKQGHTEEAVIFAKDAVLQSYKNGLKKGGGATTLVEANDIAEAISTARQQLARIEKLLSGNAQQTERTKTEKPKATA